MTSLTRFVGFAVVVSTLLIGKTGIAAELDYWDGYYAGLNLGASASTAKMKFDPSGSFLGPTAADIADGNFWRSSRKLKSSDLTGGVHAGYQQRYGRTLVGIELDLSQLGQRDSSSVTATVPTSGSQYRLEQQVETDLSISLRPRIAYVPESGSGDLLLYVTGGLTYTRAKVFQKFTQLNVAYYSEGLSDSRWLVGWVVGGGIEYALSKQWSLKTEYLYANLGSIKKNNASGNPGFAAYTTNNRVDLTNHTFRLGMTYRF
ncbi:hypothetical protein BJN45_07755 [Azonexus hydrophilus]|uniref:Outer membrane protein beta-barrel domain-containing protein n=1 Tax=Azonexus hydrophilus TaxID=418702 RepID=A0A1R1I8P3_9RHOO|nr:outer membrane beta-barrel protein [Azonexus hydrophilus]OMG55035.1 hypothetical protein BJN45_07755 [Azonexus hydrophilus]